jgi:hypothetical protein
MSGFTLKPVITIAADAGDPTSSWIAMGVSGDARVANALAFRAEDVAMVDVRSAGYDKWRVTLYMKSVATPFNIDGNTESTRSLVKVLGLPLRVDNVTEEKS